MLEFFDRVAVVVARVAHGAKVAVAWILWAVEVVVTVVRHYAPIVAPHLRTFGRTAILVVAGLIIPFIANHGNIVGLQWLVTISIVSLAVRDDCDSPVRKGLWWLNALFTGGAVLGLVLGTLSPASALSLAIPLVLGECARAFVRGERLDGWASAALAITLAIVVFPSRDDSTIATGTIGAWAIILGVFGAIRRSEAIWKTGKRAINRVTKR